MAGVTIAVQDASGGARFPAEDVVRHPLVQKIVAAYEREESNLGGKELG